jgi:hypothetical protein
MDQATTSRSENANRVGPLSTLFFLLHTIFRTRLLLPFRSEAEESAVVVAFAVARPLVLSFRSEAEESVVAVA